MPFLAFDSNRLSVGLLIALWLLAPEALLPQTSRAQPQASCEAEYEQAQEHYYAAEFDAAISLLQTCLQKPNLNVQTRVRVYRLLSFAYIARGDRQEARLAVESLLDLKPDYTPDPSRDRPDFVELVREIKASRQPADADSKRGRRWVRWTLGGVGVVAAGVLAAVLIGGGDDNGGLSNLPDQPPRPSSQ